MVDVEFVELYPTMITLAELRKHQAAGPLADLHVLRIGRLSVSPVSPAEFAFIEDLKSKSPAPAKSINSSIT
jgi:predicted RNA-binding protein with PUA-like domain